MTEKNMAYDHPSYTTRQSQQIQCLAGTVNVVANCFKAFTALKIKSIRGHVTVAGTSDNSAITLYKNGTTSVGAFANGTNTAGTELAAIVSDISLTQGEWIDFKRSATNGATMVSNYCVEYEIVPGALVTV